jgi:uncharacterized membrane protein
MQGRNATSPLAAARVTATNGHSPAEPGFRAPWGELERKIPYVVITTQPWPHEWWRPATEQTSAAERATAHPVDILARPRAQAAAPFPDFLPEHRSIIAASAGATASAAPSPARTTAQTAQTARPPKARQRGGAPRRDPAQRRRGLFARLAIVAVGLVISLIAVETASRRRS